MQFMEEAAAAAAAAAAAVGTSDRLSRAWNGVARDANRCYLNRYLVVNRDVFSNIEGLDPC
jgi:hypothetical protein